jgi:membrane protein
MNAAPEKAPKFTDTVRVVRLGIRGMYRSRLPQMSAALAFRTLFALIPMLVISVAAIGAFAEPDDVSKILRNLFHSAGISDISGVDPIGQSQDDSSAVPSADSIQPEDDPASEEILLLDDEADTLTETGSAAGSKDEESVRLEEFIADLIDRILSIPFGAIGAIGVLTLIYAALSMLIEIERAFNNVFRAQAGKGWGKRITQYWAVITLVPILLFATFYTSEQFRGLGEGAAGSVVGSVVSIAITSLLLLLAYTIIPNTRVHLRTGMVGALVAAILWELAKWGFRLYLEYSVSYAKLYGSLAVLPLFMLWVYLTWLIILFGLQVSYGLQHIELAKRIDEEDAEDRLTDPAAVLGVLAVIAERFARGKTTAVGHLTDELALSSDVVNTMVGKLTRASILRDVDGGDDRYVLARPAESIGLDEALGAMNDITDAGRGSKSTWGGAIDRLEEARQDFVRGQFVSDLIESDSASSQEETK